MAQNVQYTFIMVKLTFLIDGVFNGAKRLNSLNEILCFTVQQ